MHGTVDDRRAGLLVAAAVGDALGAGHEFGPPMPQEAPVEMTGGGPLGLAPGEWTDDTAMAYALAEAVARNLDPTSPAFEEAVVARWLEWADSQPPGMGAQTRSVLRGAQERRADGLRDASLAHFAANPEHSAGNGALMRTAPLALAPMSDWGYFTAAEAIGELTHADPVSGEACGIWTYACHHALVHGTFDGVREALTYLPERRAAFWGGLLDDAERLPITTFANNGWVVHALQAAWAAISQTPIPDDDPPAHLRLALAAAVRGGGDTDTVACIAGGLLGARWGASAVPEEWVSVLHGWPGATAVDLVRLSRRSPRDEFLSRPRG